MAPVESVKDKELFDAFEWPAPYVDRFVVTAGNVVRIAFAEEVSKGKKQAVRAAVSMTHQNAIALKNLLDAMLRPLEEALATTGERK